MDSKTNVLTMSQSVTTNTTNYRDVNMSCVTFHRELRALCSNATIAETELCNTDAQGINLAVPIAMTTFGVCGNILALLVLYASRKEAQSRRTVFFVMLSGLAWTDLLCQICVSPIAIITYANKLRWVGGKPLCLYHGFLMVSFGMVMPLIVCCMSLERLLAIKFSYCYTRSVTRRKALMTFLACWGLTITFTCLPFVGVGSYELQYPGSWCFLNFHRESTIDAIYAGVFSTVNILAILTMIVSNVTVAATLCRMRISRQLTNSPSLDRKLSLSGQFAPASTTKAPGTVIRMRRHSDMEAQMITFLCLITVAFSVCWLPLNVHILVMQFTGHTDCTLDLKVIRMAGINQILDPWLYVIFRKNSILRIMRRIRACFYPDKTPPRTLYPPRIRYTMGNKSYTFDGTIAMGAHITGPKICRHLILEGADIIGQSQRCASYEDARHGRRHGDPLCSECSMQDGSDSKSSSSSSIYDPLINLRLGDSPTDKTPPVRCFESSQNIDVDETTANEMDMQTESTKLEETPEKNAAELLEIVESMRKSDCVDKSKDNVNDAVVSSAKQKLKWFLPGFNASGSEGFASYESSESCSTRPGSIKSPHPISKQKIHPSKSLLRAMTPGFSPADFARDSNEQDSSRVFTFPSPSPTLHDLATATSEQSRTTPDRSDLPRMPEKDSDYPHEEPNLSRLDNSASGGEKGVMYDESNILSVAPSQTTHSDLHTASLFSGGDKLYSSNGDTKLKNGYHEKTVSSNLINNTQTCDSIPLSCDNIRRSKSETDTNKITLNGKNKLCVKSDSNK